MTKKAFLLTFALVCSVAQGAWGWDGSGTSTDPYLIQTNADWQQLADDVSGGETYSGIVFRMTVDIDTEGKSVGTEEKPFCGIFDGDGHTLTYSQGGMKEYGWDYIDDYCAPFVHLQGATIRHLKVTGEVYSRHKYAAGIASIIDGQGTTTIDDCDVSSTLDSDEEYFDENGDASFGGIVGLVKSTCTANPVITDCTFTGKLYNFGCAGMVGYTYIPVTFKHCMYDPASEFTDPSCATFVRTVENLTCTLDECYYTRVFGMSQGEGVFREISVPDGCTYTIESKVDVPFNGVDYWKSGATITLTAPEDMAFDHWVDPAEVNDAWLSDPWQRSGQQTIRDIRQKPNFTIQTSMPTPWQEREMDGTKYRYLSFNDYHLYISDETCAAKGYYFDGEWKLCTMIDDTKTYVTAVTGWESGKIPDDGAQIHNDLVGALDNHSITACIAPRAFNGCTEQKTLYFKDTDSNLYEAVSINFDCIIGARAFANCPNLTEIKMMEYITTGDNRWGAMGPEQFTDVDGSVFENSPQAYFSVEAPL